MGNWQWIVLGLISTGAFSFINVADRKLLHKLNAHPIAYPAFATSLGTVFTAIFAIILNNDISSWNHAALFWGIISGLISVIGSGLFYIALSKSEISKIISFERIKLVITLAIAIVIFNEPFSWWMLVGIALILFGNIYMSIPAGKRLPHIELAGILMLCSGIVDGLTIIPQKMGVIEGDPIMIALVASATRSLIYVATALFFRREHLIELQNQLKSPRMFGALVLRSLASAIGWTSFYYALSIGFIYQITGIAQFRPAIVAILAWLFLKETEPRRRLFSTCIVVIGALCLVLTFP